MFKASGEEVGISLCKGPGDVGSWLAGEELGACLMVCSSQQQKAYNAYYVADTKTSAPHGAYILEEAKDNK